MPLAALAVDWNGASGVDSNWSTAGNWVGGVAPASANTTFVNFGAAGTTFAPFVDAFWTINRLDLLGGTPYAISGSAITFDGAAPQLNVSGGAHVIANDLSFAATTTFSTSIDLLMNGMVAGSAGLTKSGTGRLTLAGGPLTWGGTTTVSAGTLQIGNGVSGPNSFSSPIVVNGEIDFAGTLPPAQLSGTVTGTGAFTVSGGMVNLMVGTVLQHTGATTVTGGTLNGTIDNNALLTIGPGGAVNCSGCVVGSLAGSGNFDIVSTTFTVGGDNTSTTFTGQLAGAGSLTKAGTGRLTLAGGPLMWGGTTTVSAGTLQIGNGISGPNSFSSPIVVNGEIDFAGTLPPAQLSGTVTGPGAFTVSGGMVNLMVGTVLQHTGATTVTGGTLNGTIDNNALLTIGPGGAVNCSGCVVGSLAGPGTFTITSTTLTVGGDNTSTTFTGQLAGPGGLTKVGTGLLTISGVNTFTGTKTVNGGALLITGSMPGPVVVNAGGTLGGTGTVNGPVTTNAGGTLAPGLSPGIINTGNLSLGGVTAIEIQGTTLGTQYDNINVTGTVTIAGGTLSLTGAYVPALGDVFTIVSNDLADAVTGTFAGLPEGATVVFNGATLRVSYIGGTGNDITLTAVSTTNVVWNGAGANNNWSTGLDWVAGVPPASGNTTFVTFPAASARFGPVVDAPWTINRMDIAGATAYAMTGSAITFAGAAPQLNTSGGAHSLANPLTLSAALAVANASNLTLSGAIGGASGLAKSGAGALTLSGISTYAGGTTVNTGTLFVNGTIPGPVTVNAGATLGGTGTVTGPVTINAGGTLAPGLSPGITNTGNLVLGGIFLVEIEGTTLGTQYDNTNVTGTVNIAGATLTLAGAYVPVAGNVFTIIANDGADAVAGTFAGLAEGATIVFNGFTLRISYVGGTGNDVVLTALAPAVASAIPTLSEWGLLTLVLLMGGVGMHWISRRSRFVP
jgi:fibronectin-binding autotransporter adhesin